MTLRSSVSAFCGSAALAALLLALPQPLQAQDGGIVDPASRNGHGCAVTPAIPFLGIDSVRMCLPVTSGNCTMLRSAFGICTFWSADLDVCNTICVTCGNGVMDIRDDGTLEECDDGNQVNGDGCDNACNFEPLYCCHEGIRSAINDDERALLPDGRFNGVDCNTIDDAGAVGRDLTDFTEFDRTIACGCGDGVLDPATEECDLGRSSDGINRNRQEYGCDSCELVCGDIFGEVNSGSYVVDWYNKTDWAYGGPYGIYTEVCDDGNSVNDDECDNYCQTCGNNQLDGDEVCDMGRSGTDGHSFNKDYGCSDDCSEFLCGNGVVDDSYVSNEEGTDAAYDAGGDPYIEVCDDGNAVNGDGCDAYCQEETGACCIAPENLFFDGQPTAVAETRSACETLAGTWNNRRTVLTRVPGASDPITNEQAQQFCTATVADKYCCSAAGDFTPFKLDPTLLAPDAADCSAYPNGVYNGPFMSLATAEKACKPVYCEANNCELKPKFDCQIGYGKDWRPPNNSEHQAAMTRLSLPMTAEGFCKYWITPGA